MPDHIWTRKRASAPRGGIVEVERTKHLYQADEFFGLGIKGVAGIEIQPITIPGPDQGLAEAFAAMMSGRADAVVIQGSLSTKRIADLAVEHRLPAASTTRAFVDAGGLMSYGADGPALFRHGAKFVQRILQGRQPNDLPIEQPTKFELAINLKTAKAMGLTIPEGFLLRADSLLE